MRKVILFLFLVLTFAITGCNTKQYVTVAFDSDGGTEIEDVKIVKGTTVKQPSDPIKEGFEFDGWYLDDEKFSFSIKIEENITLTAKWSEDVNNLENKQQFTVKFYDYDGILLKEEKVYEGQSATAPEDPIRDEYRFIGWNGQFDNVTADISVVAQYEERTYYVDFDSKIEGLKFERLEFYSDEEIYGLPVPNMDNLTFKGWYYDGKRVKDGDDLPDLDDMVFEAKWEITINLIYENGYKDFSAIYEDFLKDYSEYRGVTITKDLSSEGVSNFCSDSYNGRLNGFYSEYQDKWSWFIDEVIYHRSKADLSEITWDENTKSFTEEAALRYELDSLFRKTERKTYPITSKYTEDDQQALLVLVEERIETDTIKDTESFVFPTQNYDNLEILGWYDNSEFLGDAITEFSMKYAGKNFYAKTKKTGMSSALKQNMINKAIDTLMSQYDKINVEGNVELVSKYNDINITWTSSEEDIISNDGVLLLVPARSTIVFMTAAFVIDGYTSTYQFQFYIGGKGMKDISKGVVASYVYNGTYSLNKVNDYMLDTVDIIYASFALPTGNGGLSLSRSFLDSINHYKDRAQEKGVRVILCIGQEGASYCKTFSIIANDEKLRKTFAQNIVKTINEYGFDGVDIDWEYPGYNTGVDVSIDKLAYTALMKDIYTAVKANDSSHLVTSAIPAGPWGYVRFNLQESVKYLDYINLMSYDLQVSEAGSKAYHHSALYKSSGTYNSCSIEESVKIYNNNGVPNSKIIVGAAFYGRYSTVTTAGSNHGLGAPLGEYNGVTKMGTTIRYSEIRRQYLDKMSTNNAIKAYFDDTAKAPYIFDSANNIFITYENEVSIGYKCDYIKEKGLAGIMYWDNGSDDTNELITAINNKLSVLKG